MLESVVKRMKPQKQREPWWCGPASLAIVLDYYGIAANQTELARKTECTETREGTYVEDLARVARTYGLAAKVNSKTTMSALEDELAAKRPSIALTNPCNPETGHFVVVAAMSHRSVYLINPQYGHIHRLHRSKFRACWYLPDEHHGLMIAFTTPIGQPASHAPAKIYIGAGSNSK